MSRYKCRDCGAVHHYRELNYESEHIGPGMVKRWDECPDCGAKHPERVPHPV